MTIDKEYRVDRDDIEFSIDTSFGNEEELPSLDASGIAEFIRFDCCPRYFKLKFEGSVESGRKWLEAFKPISPLLYGAGKALEERKVSELRKKAAGYFDLSHLNPRNMEQKKACEDAFAVLKEALKCKLLRNGEESTPFLFYQVPMSGHIGVWDVNGIADLIAVWPCKDGKG